MAYPWAGFGSFLFTSEEKPLYDTDKGWMRNPSISQSRPLGSATDNVVTLAVGSATRIFECYLSPVRFAILQALVNTTNTFTDWERPSPDSRSAYLRRITAKGNVTVPCRDGRTQRRIRTSIELIGQ